MKINGFWVLRGSIFSRLGRLLGASRGWFWASWRRSGASGTHLGASWAQGHLFSNLSDGRPLATLGMLIVVHWRHCGSHGVLADTCDAAWTESECFPVV